MPKWTSPLWLVLLSALFLSACSLNLSPDRNTTTNVIDNTTPPTVTLISPQANDTYLENLAVQIQASVGNAGADISRVDISVDGMVVQTLAAPNTMQTTVFSVPARWTAVGVGQHTIRVQAFRSNGLSGEASVVMNVVVQTTPTIAPTNTVPPPTIAPTATLQPDSAAPTADAGSGATTGAPADATAGSTTAPAATSNVPTVVATSNVNVRPGPSTAFTAIPGGLLANTTATVVGINPRRDWYKIQYGNGTAWVFSGVVTVSGDLSALPVDQGPPPPATLAPTLATGATTAPPAAAGANLSITNVRILVNGTAGTPGCGVDFQVLVTVVNSGNQPTATGFFVIGRVVGPNVPESGVGSIERSQAISDIFQPGTTREITLPTFNQARTGGQGYTLNALIGLNGNPDANAGDNARPTTYTLGGSCA
jgi:uncharacterized protein YraI